MKLFIKTIYLTLIVGLFLSNSPNVYSRDSVNKHTKEEISNYLSGVLSLNKNDIEKGFYYLNKKRSISKIHPNYNVNFIKSLVLLGRFEEAFDFANSIWKKDKFFFELDLLLGLEAYVKEDYELAQKHFARINQTSISNYLFEDFFGNILISWIKASENKKNESFEFIRKIPERYKSFNLINESFLNCYFKTEKTEYFFKQVIGDKDLRSRYNFFLVNYLISKNKINEAKVFINKIAKSYNSTLLIRQTSNFINKNKTKEIKNFFDCRNPTHAIAEIFYVLANMYSTQNDYQTSNFYLNISLFLNNKFQPNKILLAENYYFQKKYDLSKKMYNSIKKIGPVYSWFASQSISAIVEKTESKDKSVLYLKKEFSLLENVNFIHFYDLANHYKDNKNYEDSIKYYSLALEDVSKGSDLVHKILYNRGISYERNNQWKKAEKDLLESLSLLPEQPYVLNYLAYSWVDKKMNIEKALGMLEEAVRLKENDGYIIDSLGWAHYRNKNYVEAEKFLQKAVQLLPLDPIVNDHYADVLWMLNRNIQARYFWKHAVSLNDIDIDVKEKINDKLIFGINEKS